MSTTPNMGMVLPTPSSTIGPDWATELNTALNTVDSHDHTPGKGTKVPSAGINIDATLPANANTISELRSTQFNNLGANLTGSTEANSVHVKGGDLWFTNSSGTAVQVTAGTSVNTPSSSNTPAGIVLPYAGSSAPSGYLLCDGSAVSRSTYAALFGVIGTLYGSGDGSTTFNLPALAGRTPIGAGTYTDPVSGSITRTLGQTLGEEKHVLTVNEMPSHTHTQDPHSHTGGMDTVQNLIGGSSGAFVHTNTQPLPNTGTTTATNQNTGGGLSHNNMQPSIALNFIIKT